MLRAHSSRHMDPEQTAALDGKRGKTSASALGVAKAGRGEASSINLAGQRIHVAVRIEDAALGGMQRSRRAQQQRPLGGQGMG